MSIDRVREFFKSLDKEDRIIEFEESTATSQMAAEAIGVELGQICKSLTFKKKDGVGCIMIQTSGDTKIKRSLFKEIFGIAPKLISPEEAKKYTGYEIGGVCCFDITCEDVDVYMDESLKRYDVIYPACGSSNSMAKLSLDECEEMTKTKSWIKVSEIKE